MFSGCQFSLYPMTDDFVKVILSSIDGLEKCGGLRAESDDLSTLLIGSPMILFEAIEQCFLTAAKQVEHLVLTATFSRGCPGETEDFLCAQTPFDLDHRKSDAQTEGFAGVHVSAQFSLYPLGHIGYMDLIYREIERTKEAGVFSRSKHFCTRLEGDALQVFRALRAVFERTGEDVGHVVLTATVSKGSPTNA